MKAAAGSCMGNHTMTLRASIRILAACASLTSVTPPTPAAAADFVLRFATIIAPDTPAYQQVFLPFVDAVAKDSSGRLEVGLKPLGGYGKPADLFNMTERGDVELAFTVQGYNPGRFPQSSVMELPLMFTSAVSGTRVLETMLKEGRFDKDYASVKMLGIMTLSPYGIFTTGRKLEQMKDLRGLRVRTPSPTVGLALARLGMIPIGVPVNLISDSITDHTVDAITFGWESISTTRTTGGKTILDQTPVMIDANFAAPALMMVMNKAAWNALPQDLQAILEKDSAGMADLYARLRDDGEAGAKQALKSNPAYTYIPLTAEQRADMERIIQPAVKVWKQGMAEAGLDGEGLYDRANELVRQSSVAAR
jgi:TRAP-type C4-dicarboxylate transport system substrate-binding protein